MDERAADGAPLRLDEARPGEVVIVRGIDGAGPTRRRLLAVGIVPGARVEVVRRAPMEDPVQYLVRGYHLLLRARDARNVRVERVGPPSPVAPPGMDAPSTIAPPRPARRWWLGQG